jgi:hypothetical protein
MHTRLGRLAVRRSRAVLIGVLLAFLGLGAYGAGAQDDLHLARWDAPGTESVRAANALRDGFRTSNPNLALLVTARDGDVDSPATERAGRELAAEVGDLPLVTDVTSYWDADSTALRGEDGRRALILARLEGTATETREELAALSPKLTRTTAEIDVRVGGQEEISRQVGEQARADFLRAEAFALTAVVLLLILVYRRTVAALLTVTVGLFSVFGTLAGLRALAQFTEVSTFAANLALVLGLGLGVDYSLFVINRYREERTAGHAPHEAVVRATGPAGRTVRRGGGAMERWWSVNLLPRPAHRTPRAARPVRPGWDRPVRAAPAQRASPGARCPPGRAQPCRGQGRRRCRAAECRGRLRAAAARPRAAAAGRGIRTSLIGISGALHRLPVRSCWRRLRLRKVADESRSLATGY